MFVVENFKFYGEKLQNEEFAWSRAFKKRENAMIQKENFTLTFALSKAQFCESNKARISVWKDFQISLSLKEKSLS